MQRLPFLLQCCSFWSCLATPILVLLSTPRYVSCRVSMRWISPSEQTKGAMKKTATEYIIERIIIIPHKRELVFFFFENMFMWLQIKHIFRTFLSNIWFSHTWMDEALNWTELMLPLSSPYILTKLKEGTYHQQYGNIREKASRIIYEF